MRLAAIARRCQRAVWVLYFLRSSRCSIPDDHIFLALLGLLVDMDWSERHAAHPSESSRPCRPYRRAGARHDPGAAADVLPPSSRGSRRIPPQHLALAHGHHQRPPARGRLHPRRHRGSRRNASAQEPQGPVRIRDAPTATQPMATYERIAKDVRIPHLALYSGRRSKRTPPSHHINTVNAQIGRVVALRSRSADPR